MSDDKTRWDQALDLLVFAPLGLALAARDELPNFVARGRSQITGQLALAKMIGQFAVTQGQREAKKQAERLVGQATEVAERLATRPAPEPRVPSMSTTSSPTDRSGPAAPAGPAASPTTSASPT